MAGGDLRVFEFTLELRKGSAQGALKSPPKAVPCSCPAPSHEKARPPVPRGIITDCMAAPLLI